MGEAEGGPFDVEMKEGEARPRNTGPASNTERRGWPEAERGMGGGTFVSVLVSRGACAQLT